MELVDLMKRVSEKSIPHLLIMYGEEQKILDIYIDTILSTLQGSRVDMESVQQVVKACQNKSLFKSSKDVSKIFVVNEDTAFLKAEDVWGIIPGLLNNSFLILRYHTLDKRSSFVRKNQQNLVEFARLGTDVLQQYIYKLLPDLSEKNTSNLIEYCTQDYGLILLEVDKIKQYHEYIANLSNGISVNDCFDELDKQGLFYKPIGDITFELTNAVLGGYPEKAIQKLDEAKRKGEPVMTIAYILYSGFRNLLAYQGLGKNKQGAMERTGMTKGELYGCTKNVGGYSIEEVRRNMLLCQQVESGIKMGTIDEDIALEYLVLSCLK